ncbi:PREDICTED: protein STRICTOSIDINE SYNTHASE-LIKE 6-like isoform X1 [Ipomoea nil]|uniref:protein STRICTOSIDINE SYNTHASE-LIKE 6-like isoform X1 n=1 Tax=Ipomoea nil TaxID=35883 RepID=UPI000900C143|nr:PREDICTED: protein STRICTOSIDINE SYNTHASE-LIKE 6-like isoform X1 [Ipomoea nil]
MSGLWPFAVLVPVILGVVIYQLDSFDPAPYPAHELTQGSPAVAPKRNGRLLHDSEKIGVGRLSGPEDIVYDPKTGVIYTGCMDGWVKRVTVNESSAADSAVEDWVNTGGRPLGLAHGLHGEVIVADAYIGLLNVTSDGKVQLLTDEADGVKFKLTDAVDVAEDGLLYFTDASWKYRLHDFIWDFFDGRPYGRLLSYDPHTKQTKVLVNDLFFANGVAVFPDQSFVIFCETPLRRCKRLYLKGEKKGSVDVFIENLPGMPDNIRYDGDGLFWIGLVTEYTYGWELAQKYPFLRKILGVMEKYVGRPKMEKNGGVFVVDLEGNPVAHYYENDFIMVSTGIKIGDYMYCGFVVNGFILRLNLTQNPAI